MAVGSVVYLLDGSSVISNRAEIDNRNRIAAARRRVDAFVQISNGPKLEDYVTINAHLVTVIAPADVTEKQPEEEAGAIRFPTNPEEGIPT